VFIFLHMADLANALLVPTCGPGDFHLVSGFFWPCYPWGWGGPFADSWFNRSKSAYLICVALELGICFAGLVAQIRIRPAEVGTLLCWLALPAQLMPRLIGNDLN
jgi:hypothetical protein